MSFHDEQTTEISGVRLTFMMNDEEFEIPINVIAYPDNLYDRISEEWYKVQGTIDELAITMSEQVLADAKADEIQADIDRERGK